MYQKADKSTDVYNYVDNKVDMYKYVGSHDDRCLLWFRMDKMGGTTVKDWSFNHNNSYGKHEGTISGATWFENGKFRHCIDFDGADDAIIVPTANSTKFFFTQNTSFTAMAWVHTDTTGAYRNIFRVDTNAAAPRHIWLLRLSSANQVEFALGNTASGFVDLVSTVTTTDTTRYIHVACIWNSITKLMYVYLNGNMVGSASQTSSFTTTPSCLLIGVDRGCAAPFTEEWNGRIDEGIIYGRALSADEIRKHYEIGRQLP